MALEAILDTPPTFKAKYIRTLLAEFERINSHLVWFINLFELLSETKAETQVINAWKTLTRVTTTAAKNPRMDGAVSLGGCIDILADDARALIDQVDELSHSVFQVLYDVVYSDFLRDRVEGIGKISKASAVRTAVTGPTARGSGVPTDVRHGTPYFIYCTGDLSQKWDQVCFQGGDTFARIQVRLWEVRQSLDIMGFVLRALGDYNRPLTLPDLPETLPAMKRAIAKVESPQGQLIYYLETSDRPNKQEFAAVRCVTPSAINYFGLKRHMLVEENIADVPLIIHSVDLSFPEIDL
jgi:Ni,Fe-hydrogenase III large subunit